MNHTLFERGQWNHINIHVLPTDRFKTFAITAYIGQPLQEDTVTAGALTPFVLRRGTETYPETKQFRERLDELYGAGFGFDVFKRGDYQIVQFRMDVINDQFVSSNSSLLEQSLQFIGEALSKPVLDQGVFRSKYVEAEKNTLQKRIEAVINDKIKYAAERCIEEMCANEPYRLHPLGQIAALQQLSEQSLYERYVRWISTSPIDLYVVGQTSLQEVIRLWSSAFAVNRSQAGSYAMRSENPQVAQVKTVEERLDVNQGKLNMGLRAYVTYGSDDYPAALMYNGILGSYPHSKLFLNVREKASLAYYAASRLDGHKGILTIQSGIEIANYDKAVNIIREQLEAMRNGEISELEMEQTKAMIANQLREINDSAYEMISFDFNSVLSGKERSVPMLLESVLSADKQAVRNIAEKVKLDTIYFLRDQKGASS